MNAKGARAENTCQWILSHPTYLSWLRSKDSQVLWLSGGPGKGKTFLSIFLAEQFELITQNPEGGILLQYFCDNQDDKRNTAVSITRGFIYQLLRKSTSLFKHIVPIWELQKEELFSDRSFETLWDILEAMLRNLGPQNVYCILDALDECEEKSLQPLTRRLKALFLGSGGVPPPSYLKMIVVSRELPLCLPQALQSFFRLELDSELDSEVTQDLHQYITVKLDEYFPRRLDHDPWRDKLEKTLVERAGGTFLWLGFAILILKDKSRSEVDDSLPDLPKGLGPMYERIFLQIKEERRGKVARILRWVVMAVRPLRVAEFADALGTESSAGLTKEEVMREQIAFCGYMLSIQQDEVHLVHQSAKDFLLAKKIEINPQLDLFMIHQDEVNAEIVKTCIAYLHKDEFVNNPDEIRRLLEMNSGEFAFLRYATLNWIAHAKSLPDDAESAFDLSMDFFAEKEPYTGLFWGWRCAYSDAPGHSNAVLFSAFYLSCYHGIMPLLKKSLALKKQKWKNGREDPVNKVDIYDRSPLYIAIGGRNDVAVRFLLEQGADVTPRVLKLAQSRGPSMLKILTDWQESHNAGRNGAVLRQAISKVGNHLRRFTKMNISEG